MVKKEIIWLKVAIAIKGIEGGTQIVEEVEDHRALLDEVVTEEAHKAINIKRSRLRLKMKVLSHRVNSM